MTSGVLAITCPARAVHVPERDDRHLKAELKNQPLAPHCIVGDLAGLAKVQVEVKKACAIWSKKVKVRDVTAEPVEALTYTGKKTRMWVGTFAVMTDLTSSLPMGEIGGGHTIGCSGERNALVLQKQHPLLSDILQKHNHQVYQLAFPFTGTIHRQFNPAANNRGMRDAVGRTTDLFRRIASDKLDLTQWAVELKFDWHKREQQREWDFLVSVYGKRQAKSIVTIHWKDLVAFATYIQCYDMWDCAFIGSASCGSGHGQIIEPGETN